nr:hypothetical protein [Miniphocaeibacter halophilus]
MSSYSDFLINDISTILFKYGINDIPIYMLDWNTVTSSDSTALSGTFFRSAIIFESILKNYNDLNGIGFYLDTYRTIVEREDKNEGILGLFLTLKIKRPIFFVLDIFHKINHNKILYRNDNILITQENDKEYNIVIYNPNYIHPLLSVDYKFTEQLTKEISIVIKNFIDGYYQIKKFIYDNSSDGIYSHIDKLGFPGYIDEEIVEYLENSIAPKLTIINIHINGDFNLNVDLKFNSIVFYRIKKIN